MKIACLNCGRLYPDSGVPYRCSNCGGLYDYAEPFASDLSTSLTVRAASTTVRDGRASLKPSTLILGEGNTPLLSARVFGREVHFKCEYANPSGSFKDRGMATLVSFLLSRGVTEAIEDSSGNAGASFAAYAARAGIKARVYVPESASGPKRQQIEIYGAELVTVPGPRSNTSEAVRKAAETGMVYASHAYLPFVLPGYATCAYEIVEQLGRAPGAIIVPAGQGGLLLGIGRGFQAMMNAGKIEKLPAIVGVQASACAPLTALFSMGIVGLNFVTEGPTIAEGVRTRTPLRAEAVVKITRESGGRFTSVDEAFIMSGRDALARLGFYVEPTSALVWHALEELLPELSDPVVAILTGSGYKVRL
ncbi:MAG: pyridoxal-phosphate dependent enzyme [Chloroflexi bacterium]|nr:pyridoxal-phosphate dependent enzyme [Chloroflexota bacterium]